MTNEQKVDYRQLQTGYKFPPVTFKVDPTIASMYLKVVGEASPLYQGTRLVHPMAVAASAMAAWSQNVSFPSGAIHTSQEFEFMGTVTAKETLTSHAIVTRKEERSRFIVFIVDFEVLNREEKPVLAGKTTFLIAEGSANSSN